MPVELMEAVVDRVVAVESSDSPTRDAVEWLVDNANAYRAVLRSVASAKRSVWISQLAFDADCVAYGESADDDVTLLDAIIEASRRDDVSVRILLNESLLLDTATSLRAALARENASDIEVRGVSRFPQLLHAKLLIVDEREAFLLGSPFVNGYWDDASHRPIDDRRPARELGGRPLHDLSVLVRGPVVRALTDVFAELWDDVAEQPAESFEGGRIRVASEPTDAIRAIATIPPRVLPLEPNGRTEILAAMEQGIGEARSLLYIEHQYLSSRAIVRALVDALERSPELEVIIVLNQNPDVTAYRGWQNARLAESKLRSHPRVGFFALWSAEKCEGDSLALNQVFVHSKVIIADDVWATVGSANMDGVSLHSYGDDFESWLGARVFRDVRNFDVNLEISDTGDATSGAIRDLRRLLWSEHLGDHGDWADRPADGWLSLWRECAATNVELLSSGAACEHFDTSRSFVLPYSSAPTPREQLVDIGVDDGSVDLRFEPSWLEVHCSPNWIRNMFA